MAKPATTSDVAAVAEQRLKAQQELLPQRALVHSQAERIAALSARLTSFEGTFAIHKSSVP